MMPVAFAYTPTFSATGTGIETISATNHYSDALFIFDGTNTTGISGIYNGTQVNFLGTGSNDTFNIWGGNSSMTGVATGIGDNNTFYIISGGAMANSTFSLVTGANSCFDLADYGNGTLSYAITAGANSTVNEGTSTTFTLTCYSNIAFGLAPIFPQTTLGGYGDMYFSVNLGTNSSIALGTILEGNSTVNVVF